MSIEPNHDMDWSLDDCYRDLRQEPVRFHRDQTPDCASIPRLLTGFHSNWKRWTDFALTHVNRDRFCQKIIEIAFQEQCPSRFALAEYRAGMSAMASALIAHTAECGKCTKRLKSWHIGQLTAMLTAARLGRETVASMAEQMSFGIGSATPVGEFGKVQELFRNETVSDDSQLRTQIWETKQQQELRARIESQNPKDKNRRVRFTLRRDDEILIEKDLVLQEDEGQYSGSFTLGKMESFRSELFHC